MNTSTFYFGIAFLFAAVLIVASNMGTDSMSQCQKKHSYDVCLTSLNR